MVLFLIGVWALTAALPWPILIAARIYILVCQIYMAASLGMAKEQYYNLADLVLTATTLAVTLDTVFVRTIWPA